MGLLDVYLNQQLVGQLVHDKRAQSFSYGPEYLKSTTPLPLSRHLPLDSTGENPVFTDAAARAFFENLLPEGDVRAQLVRRLGISKENIFALLNELGGDCAGAVLLLPVGKNPDGAGNYRPISEAELAVELVNLPTHPFLADDKGVRLSLAGAQRFTVL